MWNRPVESCKIYWFYKDDCEYCKEMEGEWSKVESKLNNPSINLIKVDSNEPKNKKMHKNFNIQPVPHIVKVFPEGTRCVYKGSRKCDDILEWAYETTFDC